MNKRKRRYTESVPEIDLRFLAKLREKLPAVGSGGSICYRGQYGLLVVARTGEHYTATINGAAHPLHLDTTKVGFGIRYWYLCPRCKKRCGKLYPGRRTLACRECCGVHYKSQSQTEFNSLKRRIASMRYEIWGGLEPDEYLSNLRIPSYLFMKPDGMRWDVFERKRGAIQHLEIRFMKGFIANTARVFPAIAARLDISQSK